MEAELPVPSFGAENIASNITYGIGDITAHIYCAQTAQELPKKHHEAVLPERLPTDTIARGSRVNERRVRARFCPFTNLSGLVLTDLRWRRLRKCAHTSQSAPLIGS